MAHIMHSINDIHLELDTLAILQDDAELIEKQTKSMQERRSTLLPKQRHILDSESHNDSQIVSPISNADSHQSSFSLLNEQSAIEIINLHQMYSKYAALLIILFIVLMLAMTVHTG